MAEVPDERGHQRVDLALEVCRVAGGRSAPACARGPRRGRTPSSRGPRGELMRSRGAMAWRLVCPAVATRYTQAVSRTGAQMPDSQVLHGHRRLLLVADDVHHRVDERQVREGLREVAEVPAGGRIELLGVELERRAERQQALAELATALALADLQQRRRPARTSRSGRCPPRRQRRRRSPRSCSGGRGRCRSARRRSRCTVVRTRGSSCGRKRTSGISRLRCVERRPSRSAA